MGQASSFQYYTDKAMTTLLTAATETDIKFTRDSNGAIDLTKPVELSASKTG